MSNKRKLVSLADDDCNAESQAPVVLTDGNTDAVVQEIENISVSTERRMVLGLKKKHLLMSRTRSARTVINLEELSSGAVLGNLWEALGVWDEARHSENRFQVPMPLSAVFALILNHRIAQMESPRGRLRHTFGQPDPTALRDVHEVPRLAFTVMAWPPGEAEEFLRYTPYEQLCLSSLLRPRRDDRPDIRTLSLVVVAAESRRSDTTIKFTFAQRDKSLSDGSNDTLSHIVLYFQGRIVLTTMRSLLCFKSPEVTTMLCKTVTFDLQDRTDLEWLCHREVTDLDASGVLVERLLESAVLEDEPETLSQLWEQAVGLV